MRRHFFEGWYYKHQGSERTLAVIPGRSDQGAFIQVITDGASYNIPYPLSAYHKSGGSLRVGGSEFTSSGISLDIEHPELVLRGQLRYSDITAINGDIMGPYRFFPMECRHRIISMRHDIAGTAVLNGENLDFTGGVGYIESDSGRSFPEGYLWVQCNDFAEKCSVMASVARIPFMGARFWGCICVIVVNGREYRLATYNGVKILRCDCASLALKRGDYRLEVTACPREGRPLAAPQCGDMSRVIHESAACPARFRFTIGERAIFDGASERASFEFATNGCVITDGRS